MEATTGFAAYCLDIQGLWDLGSTCWLFKWNEHGNCSMETPALECRGCYRDPFLGFASW